MKNNEYRDGFILPMVLVLLVVMTIFGITLMVMSTTNLEMAGNERADKSALSIAYDNYQEALVALETHSCELDGVEQLDTDGDGYIDSDDKIATQEVTCVDDDDGKILITGILKSCVNPAAERDHFIIKASGVMQNARNTIVAMVEHKTFLYYARFCQESVSYGADAVISGEFYSGDNVVANGQWVTFQRNVTVGGKLVNLGNAILEPGVILTEDYPKELSIDIGNQVDDFEDEAKICGWFIDSSNGKQCLDNSQSGGTDNLLNFSNFQGLNTATPVYDNGTDCTGAGAFKLYNTSNPGQRFNGVVFWADSNSGNLHVEGTLGSDNLGISTSVFSRSTMYIDNNIYTGYSGDPAVDGNPVNVGLVVDGNNAQIRIDDLAPNFVTINAAIMSARANWCGGGGTKTGKNSANPPTIPNGPYDLDGDGQIESLNEWLINENSYNKNDVIVAWFRGPIITKLSPSGPPAGGAGHYLNGTREYSYDTDILAFPPPFPKIHNLLHLVNYTETEEQL